MVASPFTRGFISTTTDCTPKYLENGFLRVVLACLKYEIFTMME